MATGARRPQGGISRGSRSRSGPPGRRAERRSQHQNLSRAQLLDAAEEVFGRKGFYETTLRDVAELAEFSVGSVYSFFENKEDLYRNVFLRRGEEYLPAMEATVADGLPVEQLHRLVDFEIGFFRQHPHFGRLYLRSARLGALPSDTGAIDAALARNFERAMELQAGVFARGQADGTIRDGDPAILARLFSGLISAYQTTDPAVVDGATESGGLPIDALHQMVAAAFGR